MDAHCLVLFLTPILFFLVIATLCIIHIQREELKEIKRLLKKLAGEEDAKQTFLQSLVGTRTDQIYLAIAAVLFIILFILILIKRS